MGKGFLTPTILLVFLLLILPSASAAYVGTTFATQTGASAASFSVNTTSFPAASTCSIQQGLFLTLFNATNPVINFTGTFKSPSTTTQGTTSGTNVPSSTCRPVGSVTSSQRDSTGSFQSYASVTSTATNGNATLATTISCSGSRTEFVVVANHTHAGAFQKDAAGYYPLGYYYNASATLSLSDVTGYLQSWSSCGSISNLQPSQAVEARKEGTGSANSYALVWPFNSSTTGIVWINVSNNESTLCADGTLSTQLAVVNMEDLSTATLYANTSTTCQTGPGVGLAHSDMLSNEEMSLTPNTQYALILLHAMTGSSSKSVYKPPYWVNISIDTRDTNIVCGNYSDCDDGYKTRLCEDQNGIVPDIVESALCFDFVPNAEEVIGFEDFQTQDVLECKKDAWTCAATPRELSLDIPSGWTVSGGLVSNYSDTIYDPTLNFMKMTTETSTSGFRSLLMWYHPPKPDQPIQDNFATGELSCQNSTVGYTPAVLLNNVSPSVFTTITFPSPYMTIAWDAKSLSAPPEQYNTQNNILYNPFCQPLHLCYGPCNVTPSSAYQVRVHETSVTGSVVARYYGEASDDWDSVIVDLSGANITAGNNYTIVFSLNPRDAYDSSPYGAYFDNVRIQTLSGPLGGENGCATFCDGTSLYNANQINGTCYYDVDLNNSGCVAELIAAQGNVTTQAAGIFNDILDSFGITQENIDDSGLGFSLNFLSPLAMAIYVILFLSAIAEYYLAKAGAKTGGTVFISVLLLGVLLLTVFGIVPVWVGIVFIILAGLILVNQLRGAFFGGG